MGLDKRSVRTETKTDLQAQLVTAAGDLVDETHPLPVEVVERAGFAEKAEYKKTSAPLAAQATETLGYTAVPNGVTGHLQSLVVYSEAPFEVTIEKFDGTTATTIAIIGGEAGATVKWKPENPDATLYAQAGNVGGTAKFRVTVKNNNVTGIGASANIHTTAEWDEA